MANNNDKRIHVMNSLFCYLCACVLKVYRHTKHKLTQREGKVINMKLREEGSSGLKSIIKLIGITVGVYLGFRFLLPLILPFAFAYFLAWIIRPVTESLYKRLKIPRIVGGTVSLLVLVGVFGTAFCLLINILIREAIAFLKNTPIYINNIADKLDSMCGYWDKVFGYECGTIRTFVDDNLESSYNKIKSNIMPALTEHMISITIGTVVFLGIALIVLIAAVLIVKDLPEFHRRYDSNNLYKDVNKVTSKLSEAGIAYLRSQCIIIVIVALICILGLTLLKNDYAVLLGIGIALMDALPILGSGMALVPWAIVKLVDGQIYAAAVLMTTFLVSQVVREVLEPKLIGSRIGIKPIFTLIAMYAGIKLFNIAGFILGPIGLVMITTIYNTLNEKSEGVANEVNNSYNKGKED